MTDMLNTANAYSPDAAYPREDHAVTDTDYPGLPQAPDWEGIDWEAREREESAYWEDVETPAAEVAAGAIARGDDAPPLTNLPEEFWNARPLFQEIRHAAWSRVASADATLGALLARTAAMVSPDLTFDSGYGPDGSMNLIVGVVAPSGVGKSNSVKAAHSLVKLPSHLVGVNGKADPAKFKDGVGLGTGEGIAEAYMGTVEVETGEMTKGRSPEPKTKTVRGQVRKNVFFTLDEGETLSKMMTERSGTTVGMTLRSAWSGVTMSQANAREDTTRHVEGGDYSLGLVVAYQPKTAQSLLADGAGGTPQRFLWLSAYDPHLQDVEGYPEPIALKICDGHGRPITGVIDFPPEIRKKLRADGQDTVRGNRVVEELDSHGPLMQAKLAALFAILDGRLTVALDDWRLAGIVWTVSCATRDRMLEFGRQQAEKERQAKLDAKVHEAKTIQLAGYEVEASVLRVAKRIAVHTYAAAEGEELLTKGATKKKFSGDDKREWFERAFDFAVQSQWVRYDDEERLVRPGIAKPN